MLKDRGPRLERMPIEEQARSRGSAYEDTSGEWEPGDGALG